MGRDLVYVVHPEPTVAAKLSGGLEAADYDVVGMSTVREAEAITGSRQFVIPDAILTPLGDVESGDFWSSWPPPKRTNGAARCAWVF